MSTFMQSTDVTSIGSVGVRVLPSRKGSVVRLAPQFAATHGSTVSAARLSAARVWAVDGQPVFIPVGSDTGVQPRGVPV